MNPTMIQTVRQTFSRLDSDYYIEDATIKYIVAWFVSQKKLPHTTEALEGLVEEIFYTYPECFLYEHALQAEELTLEYWGGEYYPDLSTFTWNQVFQQTCTPSVYLLGGPGEYNQERYTREKNEFEKEFQNTLSQIQ